MSLRNRLLLKLVPPVLWLVAGNPVHYRKMKRLFRLIPTDSPGRGNALCLICNTEMIYTSIHRHLRQKHFMPKLERP